MAKGLPITMRLDDEVKSLIESCEGSSFTEKFETVVHEYFRTIPEREKKLKNVESEIAVKQNELKKLTERINLARELESKIQSLSSSLVAVNHALCKTFSSCKDD